MDTQVNRHSRYKILKLNLALYYLAKFQVIDRDIKFIEDRVKKINFEIAEDIKRKLNVSYKVEKKYKV